MVRSVSQRDVVHREQSRRQQQPASLASALFMFIALLILLSGCGTQPSSTATGSGTPSAATVSPFHVLQAKVVPAPPVAITIQTARRQLYRFSTSNVGLMQLAADAHGMIWAGEMNNNQLGRLDTHSGDVTTWTPPNAQYGIMTTIIDTQGNVWFAEQNANYIGRFDPGRKVFRIFPLGRWNGNPLGPQDLRFDNQGLLWFTAPTSGIVGDLNPTTGDIHLWVIPAPSPTVPSSPASLTIASNGLIWFGDDAGGAIGSLNPRTSQVTLYLLPDAQTQVFELAVDGTGRLWFTEVLPGKLGLFDPSTGTLSELPIPKEADVVSALYGLVVDHQGNVWFVDVGADMLARYTTEKHILTFFRLSLSGSAPSALALDPAGNVWFTAGDSPANYVGEMIPGSM